MKETTVKIEMLFICLITLVTHRVDVTGWSLWDIGQFRYAYAEDLMMYKGMEFFQKYNGKHYLLDAIYEHLPLLELN